MATYDNKIWLLKNIRDAFIATDDTGLCEIVMVGEDFSKIFLNKALEEKKRIRQEKLSQPGMSKNCESNGSNGDYDDEREIITQYEIYPDMEESDDDDMYGSYIRYEEYGGHRQRSNTSQWLDKKEQALKKSAKIKVIKWENMSNELTTEEISRTFSKVEIKKQEKKKSLLAEQLEKCPDLPHRHYLEYAKFDGTAQLGLSTKCFKIFMTMLPEKHQNYPIVVCVIGTAKIRDLIGFTCYKYSIEHPEITLGNVHDYGLCIADDDGEVDFAFPCLDANEPCSKFGFTCLGLVELNSKDCMNHATISLPEDGGLIGSLLFPKPETSHNQQPIASRHNTGGSNTSRELKRAMDVLNEGKLGAGDRGGNKSSHIGEAPQYKTYRVQLIHKVRANTNVQLTISVDRIEVEPTAPQKHVFWTRSKYIRHSIDLVAWCQILESKSSKTIIRIVYSPTLHSPFHDKNVSASSGFFNPNTVYKFHDFECDHDTAKEIVDKVNTILDLRNSPCRREYKTAKEKKMHARRSFNTKHMS